MTDYGLHYDTHQIISGSSYLFRSGALADSSTAISASSAQVIAITCSANYNNRLTKLTSVNANATITITSGSSDIEDLQNDQKLILRYISDSDQTDRIPSASDSTVDHLLGGIGANIIYVDIPLLNNDDSFTVAYKTVRALTASVGYNKAFNASLVDDGSTFRLSSSLGENMAIGTSFEVRNSSSYELPDDYLLSSSGFFTITSLNSGSVAIPDFSGTEVQIDGMQVGTSLMVGGGSGSQAFDHNLIQTGSGFLNQVFFEGFPLPSSASIGMQLDGNDKASGIITGSGTAMFYLSSSGKIGIGTSNPTSEVDITGDEIQMRRRSEDIGVKMNSEGNLESFTNDTELSTTGSEIILNYTRDSFGAISSNDVLGSIRWISPSTDLADEVRTAGEAASITSICSTTAVEGITADLIFKVAQVSTDRPKEMLRLGANGNIYVSGSLVLSGSVSGIKMSNTGHITASGNISASGKIYADEYYSEGVLGLRYIQGATHIGDGSNIILSGDVSSSGNIWVSGSGEGTGHGNIYLNNTGDITASNNISASGMVIGKNIRAYGEQGSIMATLTRMGSGVNVNRGMLSLNDDTLNTVRIMSRNDSFISGSDAQLGIGTKSPSATLTVQGNIFAGRSSGHITASGNISASGNVIITGDITSKGKLIVPEIHSNGDINYIADADGNEIGQHIFKDRTVVLATIDETGASFINNITASGTIRSSGSIVHGNVSASGNIVASGFISSSGRIQTLSHITASGNISASGTIRASAYEIEGKSAIGYNDPRIIFGQTNKISTLRGDTIEIGAATDQHITASGIIKASGSGTTAVYIGGAGGHITASGNIIATGTIVGSNTIKLANTKEFQGASTNTGADTDSTGNWIHSNSEGVNAADKYAEDSGLTGFIDDGTSVMTPTQVIQGGKYLIPTATTCSVWRGAITNNNNKNAAIALVKATPADNSNTNLVLTVIASASIAGRGNAKPRTFNATIQNANLDAGDIIIPLINRYDTSGGQMHFNSTLLFYTDI